MNSALPRDPPLVHFTNADWSYLADGQYDVDTMVEKLNQAGAFVVVAPHHLQEWVPLAQDSLDRRLGLAERLGRVVYLDEDARSLWSVDPRQVRTSLASASDLRALIFDERGEIHPWIHRSRNQHRRLGEAEFFARSARLASRRARKPLDIQSPSRLARFHKLNARHGSDLSRAWNRSRRLSAWMTTAGTLLDRVVPSRMKEETERLGRRLQKFLDGIEPRIEAAPAGVDVDSRGFRFWWAVRRKLWAKPSEVGGLGERMDLEELKLWPICSLLTVDRRIENAVGEALRELNWPDASRISARFVRARQEQAIWKRLDWIATQVQAERGVA
ncbi:MAG: hypothetical protein ACQEXJ_21555 [Myxococcota bacterium]